MLWNSPSTSPFFIVPLPKQHTYNKCNLNLTLLFFDLAWLFFVFVRLFFRSLLRSHCFLHLGASWCRFWALKLTLRPSKTLISLRLELDFRKIKVWDLKMLLMVFWGSLGLVLGPLGGLLGVSWATCGGSWGSLRRPLGASDRTPTDDTHWVHESWSSWCLLLTSFCHSFCLVLRFYVRFSEFLGRLSWKPHFWSEFAGRLSWKPDFWSPKICMFDVVDECLSWNRYFSNIEGCIAEYPHFMLLILLLC